MAPPVIGIDLGTTYSAVARLDENGRPETLNNAEGDKLTPSVLLFDDNNVIVGKEALKAIATDASHVAMCMKRELGQRFFRQELEGRHYPPEALQAWVLNKLRLDTSKIVGPFEKAVITVPAYFDEVRRKATQDAGYIAGLDVLDIINEPTAAAIAYGHQQGILDDMLSRNRPMRLLVYDLGGGTFDITIMEIASGAFVALATDGDVRLGGQDWDQRLVDFVADDFLKQFGVDPREDPNTAGRLWRDCEDAKRTLSARSKTTIPCDYQGHASRTEVTREQFEKLTADLLNRTSFTTRQTLQAAGLTWDDIDRILLVGGSTRMPAVVDLLQQMSGKEPDTSIAADEVVAHGAALRAGILMQNDTGERPRFNIKNVNSHSLGVVAVDPATKRPRNAILIPRNTPLPVSAKRTFKTQKDGQNSVLVQIVEGESATPDHCVQVGRCSVRDLPPELPAETPIEVRFHYEENGRLQIKVAVADAKKEIRHEINRENSLTREQLNTWRRFISGAST
ncbi:MAG: Hsp70 family protein [Planctomycetales bacterium]|nr:Hsp70 family protein [Planctomycetales bacterium]